MGLRARWQARRRMATGTHLPHPAIRVTQGSTAEFDFDRPMELRLDGRRTRDRAGPAGYGRAHVGTVYA